ncbi:MAG: GspH/FimT family pseudopilin [Dechloromonas sp.]|jgi:type IV fimbrial biogenesis protein FimT|nr:GspH/FimT family pseudopilin [Dechloromonas sp.]
MMMRHSGFSLIELMIVLAIVGIGLLVGLPSYANWVANSRIRNAAESIQNGLQLARSEAVRRNARVSFVVAADSGWTVGCVAVTAECPAVIQSRAASEGSTGATVVETNSGTANTVFFNSFGASVTAAGAAGPARVDVDVDSATLAAADSRNLRVSVFSGGAVRMCDPNLGGADPRRCVN